MRRHPATFAAGLIFMAIGIAYILEAFEVWEVRLGRFWPVVLIVVGAVVILGDRDSSRSDGDSDTAPDPSEDR
ncbi:MAG: DUF5668 domain-containing protein [Acidimicrobiia bacterium]